MRPNMYPGQTRPEVPFGIRLALAAAALALVAGCDGAVSNPLKRPPPQTRGSAPPTSCSTHASLTGPNTVHVTAVPDNGKPLYNITYYLGKKDPHNGSLVDFLPPQEVKSYDGTDFKGVPKGVWGAIAEVEEPCRQSPAIIIR